MATIPIDGVTYDEATQPCEIAAALRVVKVKRTVGGQLLETEIRSPVSQNRIKLQEVPIAELNSLIEHYENACSVLTGSTRRRYRKTFRYSC
jgi:hypothetical protein